MSKKYEKLWYYIPSVLIAGLVSILIFRYHSIITFQNIKNGVDEELILFISIGLFAQLVDGTLGMGYGATSTSFLLAVGVPPAVSSTGVHVAEMFTTGASAISHHRFGNINKRLVYYLVIPGVLGSIVGAYLLAGMIDSNVIKPYITVYMIVLAVLLIIKGVRKTIKKKKTKQLSLLALFGGFMDAVGGGGWGPIVTSTLIGRGRHPGYTVGSVNAAEFAISFASGITFLVFGGINGWQVILGLVVGGIVAAPLGAMLVGKIPRKSATVIVGSLLIILCCRTLYKIYFG